MAGGARRRAKAFLSPVACIALAASRVAFGHIGKRHQTSPDGPGGRGREQRICRADGKEKTSGCRGLFCQSPGVPVSVPSPHPVLLQMWA